MYDILSIVRSFFNEKNAYLANEAASQRLRCIKSLIKHQHAIGLRIPRYLVILLTSLLSTHDRMRPFGGETRLLRQKYFEIVLIPSVDQSWGPWGRKTHPRRAHYSRERARTTAFRRHSHEWERRREVRLPIIIVSEHLPSLPSFGENYWTSFLNRFSFRAYSIKRRPTVSVHTT